MNKWLRRLSGAIKMGLIWAGAWFGAGMVLLVVGLLFGATADVPFPILFGILGFFAGVTFSAFLGLLEGSRSFDQTSLPRFAGWGGLGGLLLSVVFVSIVALVEEGPSFLWNLVALGPIFAVAGAGCASGALAIARRAKDGESLEAGEDVAEVGLTADEVQELLGGGS